MDTWEDGIESNDPITSYYSDRRRSNASDWRPLKTKEEKKEKEVVNPFDDPEFGNW